MRTGYGWVGIRQVCAMLLGAGHVPERLCGRACLQRGAITSVRPFTCTAKVSEGTNRNLPAKNTLGQLSAVYMNPESHNAQHYRQTDGQTDG